MYQQPRAHVIERRLSAEDLFVAHAAFVAGFAHRLGIRSAEIDDVVQEVFMVVHRKGGFVEGTASPRTWLGAITLRTCRGRRRSIARRREDNDEAALQHSVARSQSPAVAAEVAESIANVQRALESLDLEHRGVFVLYEIEGEPCTAIAEALQLPIGTVYSRLYYARQRFADAYQLITSAPHRRAELPQVVRST